MKRIAVMTTVGCLLIAGALIISLQASRYYKMEDMPTIGLGMHKDAVALYFSLENNLTCKWAKVERIGNRFNVYLLREGLERDSSIENVPVVPFRDHEYEVKIPLDTSKELPVTITLNAKQVVGTSSPLKN